MKPTQDIRPTNFADALGERYLSYALSTITSRSLPDIRDGLKPVQRRILYAMLQLKLDPKSGYKKCARVVGDVIGKYHPHGDQSVYDALVRMAQEFAARYPLVDGQGNFGNIDGDNAAAMRYTESRLTDVALALLEGISENAVDFRETYDGSEDEPIVLPAAFPNLLANGTTGIAVGMATSIPPHNVDELCQALLHLIKAPQCSIEKLLDFVEGPDFPTGGVIVDPKASLIKAYSTGRGSFRLRAKWEVEKQKNGQYLIVITEIPYQIQKSKLIERIAELLTAKKLGLLQDVRDESTMDVRIVLEPKSRTIDPEMLMQSLFQQTELEVKVSLNLNVLDHQGIPRVMNLREALQSFLDHRYVVFERRSQNRLAHIDHRLEVLEGYLIAYLNLDEVIRIIREEDDAKAELIQRFKLTDVQAESILNMRLRSLRKLEEIEIRSEHQKLSDEKAELLAILGDTDKRWSAIADEIKALRTQFGKKTSLGARRTAFAEATLSEVIPLSAFIEKEPITVICSEQGWIRAAKGHLKETDEIKYKDGDQARFIFHAMTTDRLLLFASDGRFFTLGADKLPGGRGFGEPVRLMCSLGEGEDIVTLMPYVQGSILVVATDEGRGFKVSADDVIAQTRTGKNVLTPSTGHKATHCIPLVGDHVAVVGENRKILVFPADSLPLMNRGKGVRLQKYKDGRMSDLITLDLTQGLTWQMGTRTRTETDLTPWLGHRAGSGRLAPTGFPRNHKFS